MTKGLEALNAIKYLRVVQNWGQDIQDWKLECLVDINDRKEVTAIEKELKALEIIKITRVDINLIKASEEYDDYCCSECLELLGGKTTSKQRGISEEEFYLLKEVLS